MVQIGQRGWTLNALHAACQMAKKQNGCILLVKMVPVQHLAWLGTELGYMDLTYKEEVEIEEYQDLIEEYEVEYGVCVFQYTSLANGIIQLVEEAKAQILFATLPTSIVPGWRNFQLYRLRQSLTKQGCRLTETSPVDGDYTPTDNSPRTCVEEEQPLGEELLAEDMPLVFNPFEIKERV